MRKESLQEATQRALIEGYKNLKENKSKKVEASTSEDRLQKLRDEVFEYIIDDVHRLEDFTDIEISSEEDNELAYSILNKNLAKFNIYQLQQMINQINKNNLDLVSWGHKVLESKKVTEARLNFLPVSELPDMCYGILPSDKSIIIIKKGERGYYQTDLGSPENAEEVVDDLNEKMGVTKDQRFTMEIRSINNNWVD